MVPLLYGNDKLEFRIMVQLTQNQKAALARDKNIAVTAGAGTGKTLILVERYIDILIEHDVDIRELLAITFTNKAAAEMLNRVALKIDASLADPGESENHTKLLKIRNHLSSAYISTIHSFCSRLLREYPMEAGGLDPGFNTLNKIQSDFMVEECIDTEIAQVDTQDPEWLDLFRNFHPESIKYMLRVSLEHRFEMKDIIVRYAETDTDKLYEELKQDFFRRVNSEFTLTQLDLLKKSVAELLDLGDSSSEISVAKDLAINGLKNFEASGSHTTINFWTSLFVLAGIMTSKNGTAYKNLAQLGGQSVWTALHKEMLLKLSNSLSPIAVWMSENISTCPGLLEIAILNNLKKYYGLYQKVETRYTLAKTKQDSIDFDDQQLMAYQLLKDNDHIRNQVANRFKYIMVDEFQDTNLLQWKIIELISEDYENNVFIVGDPKQSIYGFRNADVRVFNSVKKKLAEKNSDGDLLLYESFRFKKVVNDFVNCAFPDILQVSSENLWEVGYEKVETKRPDADKGKLELALLNKTKDENVQAKFIASHILGILSETEYKAGEISIMLRSRTHLAEIENTLREFGIPFQTIGGIGFYQGQEIYDTYHLLKFLMNPSDDLALVGLLRSPFANVSDEGLFFLAAYDSGTSYWHRLHHLEDINHLPKEDHKKLNMFFLNATKWLGKRDRIGYFELLSEIFNESFYRAIISSDFKGDQIIANIDKILNILLDYEKGRFSSMVDFAESLNRLINTYQKEGEAFLEFEEDNSVKIMTIHQAKGLEYPVVYLPYLNQKLNTAGGSAVYFDDHWGVVSNVSELLLKSQDPVQESFYLYDLQKLKYKRKEIAELKRLFYVGCTRAQDHLILSGELSKNKVPSDTPLSWLMASLKLDIEELTEDPVQISPDLSIQIHRAYSEIGSIQEKERKKTIQSLEKLNSIVMSEREETVNPDFLKKSTDKPEGEIFSATQLMTFIEDKEEYHRRYHLGFFEDDYEKLGMGKTGEADALLRGVLLHKLMESYPAININQLLDEVDLSDDQIKERLFKELSDLVKQIDKSHVIKSSLEARDHKNEVGIIKQIGSDFITGTLDRIYKNEQNQWIVLDYKTNHINSGEVPFTAEQYQIQIETYALLIASVYPEQETYPIGLYFIYPDVIHSEVFDKDRLSTVEEKFEKVIQEIKQYYPYTDHPVL
jgi:ATP-dependent helicase/nuclease subunit A